MSACLVSSDQLLAVTANSIPPRQNRLGYFSTAEQTPSAESSGNLSDQEDGEEEEALIRDVTAPPSLPLEIASQRTPGRRSILICGKTYSRRNLGLMSALACGTWGGSALVPMHYSKGDTHGMG